MKEIPGGEEWDPKNVEEVVELTDNVGEISHGFKRLTRPNGQGEDEEYLPKVKYYEPAEETTIAFVATFRKTKNGDQLPTSIITVRKVTIKV